MKVRAEFPKPQELTEKSCSMTKAKRGEAEMKMTRVGNISGETIRKTIAHQRLDTEQKYEAWRKAHPRAKLPPARAVRQAWAKANRTWKFMLPVGVR